MANVVITGSTKGIGRGLAEEFVRRGHNVTVSSRHQADAERVARELTAIGPGKATGTQCDVGVRHQVQALWDHAASSFGSVDIWINNAGYATARFLVHELPEELVHTLIDSNLKGAVFGSQVAVNGMRAQGHGALYNMLGGSFQGNRLTPSMGVYSATKSGIWRLTKYLLEENKGQGLMIGSISPGMLISDNWFEEQKHLSEDEWLQIKPLLNTLCDHVETAAPWIVEQVLANERYGKRIAWLTGGKIMRRFFQAKVLGRQRDLFSRYGLP
jgi:NAD(P)-dependent dehydrogenase (short-subunit alcohol dehydrogenase family)